MTDLEGVLQVLLFQILLEYSGVEVVVHVLVEPSQRSLLYRLEAGGSDWLSICGTLDIGHATPSCPRVVMSRLYFSRPDERQRGIERGLVVARDPVATHGFHPLDLAAWFQSELRRQRQNHDLVGLVVHSIDLIALDVSDDGRALLYYRDVDGVGHGTYVTPLLTCEDVLQLQAGFR